MISIGGFAKKSKKKKTDKMGLVMDSSEAKHSWNHFCVNAVNNL